MQTGSNSEPRMVLAKRRPVSYATAVEVLGKENADRRWDRAGVSRATKLPIALAADHGS